MNKNAIATMFLFAGTLYSLAAGVLVHESFSGYALGPITGQAVKGKGLTGSWQCGSKEAGMVEANSISHPWLRTEGQHLMVHPHGIFVYVSFDQGAFGPWINPNGGIGKEGKTLYLSVLVKPEGVTIPSSQFNIALMRAGEPTLSFGQIWEQSVFSTSHGEASLGVKLDTREHLLVARMTWFDWGVQVDYFINPEQGKDDHGQTLRGSAYPGKNFVFDGIGFKGNTNGWRVDEIRLGETFADVVPAR